MYLSCLISWLVCCLVNGQCVDWLEFSLWKGQGWKLMYATRADSLWTDWELRPRPCIERRETFNHLAMGSGSTEIANQMHILGLRTDFSEVQRPQGRMWGGRGQRGPDALFFPKKRIKTSFHFLFSWFSDYICCVKVLLLGRLRLFSYLQVL